MYTCGYDTHLYEFNPLRSMTRRGYTESTKAPSIVTRHTVHTMWTTRTYFNVYSFPLLSDNLMPFSGG